jgi:hypothetical protein
MAPLPLKIDGTRFRDSHRREVTFRGINVGGDAKYPRHPDQPSNEPEAFYDADNVSFVGRPFSEDEAHQHFTRLRGWGYNTIRYIFTWEALEHAGPGKYNEDFIAHTIKMLRIAKELGFYVFMDPHQDVWSRFSGGSGAPIWTLYACGLDPRAFNPTHAAMVHNTWDDVADYPKMIWSTNYTRLVCQTMFTLFFGGKDFAPIAIIDGKNIQDWLTDHYLDACKHLARRIHEAGDLEYDCVIGWESLNEPNRGLISWQDLSVLPEEAQMRKGTCPTPWQAILTGSGRAVEIDFYEMGSFGPYKSGKQLVDPGDTSVWLSDSSYDEKYGFKRDPGWKLGECLWAQCGVWDPKEDRLLQADYFSYIPSSGAKLDYEKYTNVYFMAHYRKYKDAMRSIQKDCMMLLQPPVLEIPPSIKGTDDDDPNTIFASHYYDGLTLITKHWNRLYNVDVLGVMRGRYMSPTFALKIGETAIRNCLRDQLSALRQEGLQYMGTHPIVFTEIGIPYDMDDKYAYKTGDYSSQTAAMDANHFALEGSGAAGYTLWTYVGSVSNTPDTLSGVTNDYSQNNHQWGDMWNGEDLSIFSIDDHHLPETPADIHQASLPDSTNASTLSIDKQPRSSTSSPVTPRNLKAALRPHHLTTKQSSPSPPELSTNPGLRAAEAYVRPSPLHTVGSVTKYGFDLRNCVFTFTLDAPTAATEEVPTLVFLPEYHFPADRLVIEVTSGTWKLMTGEGDDTPKNMLRWLHKEGEQKMTVRGIKRKTGVVSNGEEEEEGGYFAAVRQLAQSCVIM